MLSAHPLKAQAASLLEAQLRMPGSPSRTAILALVAQRLQERQQHEQTRRYVAG